MRRYRLSIVLAMVTLLAVVSTPSFAWKFVSIADSRGSTNGVNTTELNKIVDRVNLEHPDLVVFQGDAVTGSTSDSTVSSEMNTWVTAMNRLACPWYYTPGNHEISTSTAQENVLRAKVVQPLNGPSSDQEMVFSFDHQNAHFVFLNSNHYGQVHHVQRTWLASDLSKTKQPHVFVMVHEPAYPTGPHIGSSLDAYPTERDDLWKIMTSGRVGMYFCGHEHLYSRSKHGSIYQVINGSCGAPLYTGVTGTIAKYDYVVVSINTNTATCTAKDDAGNTIDSWSYTATLPPSTTSPLVSLAISADKATIAPSEVISYTMTYTNKGTGTASNTQIRFPVPAYTTYVAGSASTGGVLDSTTNAVTWTVPSLAAGATGVCSVKVKVN